MAITSRNYQSQPSCAMMATLTKMMVATIPVTKKSVGFVLAVPKPAGMSAMKFAVMDTALEVLMARMATKLAALAMMVLKETMTVVPLAV